MNDTKPVVTEQHEGWLEIAINRPERRNALIPPVMDGIRDALANASSNDAIQSVILRGEGGYFTSGIDLKALQADPPPPWRDQMSEAARNLHLALYHFEKPVIGAFEKYGINAGSALALACDVLIAGETAFLQVGEIQQGVGIPMNAAWMSIKVPEPVMARMTFYGDRVPGPELVKLGLAAESVADDFVVARCREIAAQIASFPAGASTTIKRSIIAQRGIENPEDHFKQSQGGGSLLNASKVQ